MGDLWEENILEVPVTMTAFLFRGPLARQDGVLEFPVRQTRHGATVDYLATRDVDETNVCHAVASRDFRRRTQGSKGLDS